MKRMFRSGGRLSGRWFEQLDVILPGETAERFLQLVLRFLLPGTDRGRDEIDRMQFPVSPEFFKNRSNIPVSHPRFYGAHMIQAGQKEDGMVRCAAADPVEQFRQIIAQRNFRIPERNELDGLIFLDLQLFSGGGGKAVDRVRNHQKFAAGNEFIADFAGEFPVADVAEFRAVKHENGVVRIRLPGEIFRRYRQNAETLTVELEVFNIEPDVDRFRFLQSSRGEGDRIFAVDVRRGPVEPLIGFGGEANPARWWSKSPTLSASRAGNSRTG